MSITPTELSRLLKDEAYSAGFELVGICRAAPSPHWDFLVEWVAAGYVGDMDYIARRLPAYRDPRSVLPSAQSLVVVGSVYRVANAEEGPPAYGRISCYAWGQDYHRTVRRTLEGVAEKLRQYRPSVETRIVVDTAPILERSYAQMAGLGWIGKNTLLINPRLGSYTFLGILLTSEALEPDPPFVRNHCGKCRACLEVCPTQAFVAPGVLDARKCLSFWTIETKQLPPAGMRAAQGDWLFGCDLCQVVCPWNHRAPLSSRPEYQPVFGPHLSAIDLLLMTDEEFRARFRHSPLKRAGRAGLARSAAIVLGNTLRRLLEQNSGNSGAKAEASANTQFVPTASAAAGPGKKGDWISCSVGLPSESEVDRGLEERIRNALQGGLLDPEPVVRAACAWALAADGSPLTRAKLAERLRVETDSMVQAELIAAFEPHQPGDCQEAQITLFQEEVPRVLKEKELGPPAKTV